MCWKERTLAWIVWEPNLNKGIGIMKTININALLVVSSFKGDVL